jgi:hypothetical protein
LETSVVVASKYGKKFVEDYNVQAVTISLQDQEKLSRVNEFLVTRELRQKETDGLAFRHFVQIELEQAF